LLLNLIVEDASLGEVFDNETGALAAEVVFAFKHELATTLADCLLRRTMVGLNSSCGLTAIEGAAAIAVRYFGWSKERFELETASYKKEIARKFFLNTNL
jgi:glycerol-3-phosphate dehydrogenase